MTTIKKNKTYSCLSMMNKPYKNFLIISSSPQTLVPTPKQNPFKIMSNWLYFVYAKTTGQFELPEN